MQQLRCVVEKEIGVIALTGSLTLSSSAEVKEKIKQFLILNQVKKVVFDLTMLEMIDSSGLGTLIAIFKQVNQENGQIIYAGANDYVKKIFGFAKLDKIFILADDVNTAKNML